MPDGQWRGSGLECVAKETSLHSALSAFAVMPPLWADQHRLGRPMAARRPWAEIEPFTYERFENGAASRGELRYRDQAKYHSALLVLVLWSDLDNG